MSKIRISISIICLVLILIVTACGQQDQSVDNKNSQEELIVYTSIYPLYDVANKIGGEHLTVRLIVPNGAEIHSYKPSPKKMTQLERADILFYNGVGLEPWADKVVKNLKEVEVRTVEVSQSVQLLKIKEHEEHEHGQYDPHIWLNPINMKQIAKMMRNKFIDLDPTNKDSYQKNYLNFAHKIDRLDQDFKEVLTKKKQNYILVSHEAFNYLADRYKLKQLAISGISPHEEPSPKNLANLVKKAKEYKLQYIFMETSASSKTAKVLAQEADLEILALNPIAGLTTTEKEDNEDYFSLMRKNLRNLRKALVK